MDKNTNPFNPGAGVSPPELAGRAEVLETAETALARTKRGKHAKSLMILGLRGVGKTVLLNQIKERAVQLGYLAEMQEAHDGDPAAFRPAAGSGIAVAVVDVEFLSSASAAAPSGGTGTTMVNGVGEYRSVCPASGDAGRQRLTVTATLAGRAPVTGSVVVAAPQGTP